ncbi:MAG: hypothetical protein M3063_01710 [Actinomycetota bacterium]|nr:hypothetical protein [Actinomycetota bacterium]
MPPCCNVGSSRLLHPVTWTTGRCQARRAEDGRQVAQAQAVGDVGLAVGRRCVRLHHVRGAGVLDALLFDSDDKDERMGAFLARRNRPKAEAPSRRGRIFP